MILGTHLVTVLRATTTTDDAYGNAVPNWPAATAISVSRCSVQPVTGAEVTTGRETVVSRWQLYAPDGTDLLATDRVLWDGATYEVDGEPQRWDFPPLSHVVALLRKGDA